MRVLNKNVRGWCVFVRLRECVFLASVSGLYKRTTCIGEAHANACRFSTIIIEDMYGLFCFVYGSNVRRHAPIRIIHRARLIYCLQVRFLP